MAERYRCPKCDKVFDSLESYKNHACISTYGGSGDLRKARDELHETEGGTGGGRP